MSEQEMIDIVVHRSGISEQKAKDILDYYDWDLDFSIVVAINGVERE